MSRKGTFVKGHGVIPISAGGSIKGTTFIKETTLEGPKNKGVRLTAKQSSSKIKTIKSAKVHQRATALATGLPSHSRVVSSMRILPAFVDTV